MTGPVFVDTNVFVYLYDSAQPEKQLRAREWIELVMQLRLGRISYQVLHELYATLTRKLKKGVTRAEAQQLVRGLTPWEPVPIDNQMIEQSWSIEERYDLSWWDSLIVAAALRSQCSLLLTEDLQHGQIFSRSLRVVNPFESGRQSPSEILSSNA